MEYWVRLGSFIGSVLFLCAGYIISLYCSVLARDLFSIDEYSRYVYDIIGICIVIGFISAVILFRCIMQILVRYLR